MASCRMKLQFTASSVLELVPMYFVFVCGFSCALYRGDVGRAYLSCSRRGGGGGGGGRLYRKSSPDPVMGCS